MNVLFYNHTSTVSGAERVLLLISAGLRDEKFSPAIMCPEGDLADAARNLGIPVQVVPELYARFTLRPDLLIRYLVSIITVVFQIRNAVRANGPDLVHANSTRAGITMTLASIGCRIPVIWHIHDILPRHPITTMIRVLIRFSPRSHLFAVSNATAVALRGTLLRNKPVEVILNCVDLDRFRPDPEVRLRYRAELGLAESDVAVAIVGQITRRKGQLGLVRAFGILGESSSQSKLLIIGKPLFVEEDQAYFAQVKAEAAGLPNAERISFLGGRSDVAALMQAADILVVNSLAEPCGLVVLEGMASALPVIATNVGGNPEMIIDGQSGSLTPADNPERLATAIQELASNPVRRRELGANARARVAEVFRVPTYLDAVSRFYSRCAGIRTEARGIRPKSMSNAAR